MKIFKRYLALLMAAAALLLTTSLAGASEITGAYVETPISFDQTGELVGLAQGVNGVVAALQNGEKDQVLFYQINGSEAGRLNCTFAADANNHLRKIAMDPNGNIVLLVGAQTDNGSIDSVYRQSESTFTKLFDYAAYGSSFAALDNGMYLVSGKNGITVLDETGREMDSLDMGDLGFIMDNGTLFSFTYTDQGGVVTRHNYPERKTIDSITLENINYLSDANIVGDGQGGFYAVNPRGIMHVGAGSTKFETIIEGASMAYAYPESSVQSVAADNAGNLYVQMSEPNDRTALYQYAWSDSAVVREKVEFTIASIYGDPMIKRAVSDYMRANPNVNITYRTYLEYSYFGTIGFNTMEELEENRTRFDDVLRNINTEILSGNAPDILLLDGMNVANLAEKGLLDDMSAWAQKYLDDGTLLSGPVEGFRRENGMLPCIPLSFTVPAIWADKQQIASLSNFNDLVRAANAPMGEHLLDISSERELLMTFYPIFAASWTGADGKVAFTKEQLTGFLEQLKAIQTALPAPDTTEGNHTRSTNLLSGKADAVLEELGEITLQSVWYTMMKNGGKAPSLTWLPAVDGVHAYKPSALVSISASSEHKDIAYALLDMIIADMNSEQVEKSYTNYSVVTSLMKKQLEKGTMWADGGNWIAQYKGKEIMLENVDEQTFADMYRVILEVDTPVFQDYTLLTMMIQTCEPYLKGNESLESVVEKFYGYIKAYLAE